MNERIKELAQQSGWDTHHAQFDTRIERFAELIVREVFAKIEDERFEIYQPVKDSVMKHFGVEK